MNLFLSSIEVISLTRASVSVSVCFCLETAAVKRDAMDLSAGYGWLWMIIRFYLVLGTEFVLSVAVHEGAGPITIRLLRGRRQPYHVP